MTCHDARERLSDLLDDALEARPRALVEAHLAECADCRLELERLRATVGLLRRVEPARAPVGFVDRVMARARPAPWYRRLGRWLFVPLRVKLPVEAAAVVLIAGLAVLLMERVPEQRDAARLERPATVATPEVPRPSPPAPATKPEVPRRSPPAGAAPPAIPRESPPGSAKQEERDETPVRLEAPAAPAPAPPPAARTSDEKAVERRELASRQSAVAARSAPAAGAAALGRLGVKDRAAAVASLAELLTRVGGKEIGRREDASGVIVDVVLPEGRYDELVRGLEALGTWTGPAASAATAALRISIHVVE